MRLKKFIAMAKKLKSKINCDGLKISLIPPKGYWELISKKKAKEIIHYDGFYLFIYDDGRTLDNGVKALLEPQKKVIANVVLDNGVKVGDMVFCNPNYYNGRVFFTIDNKALYTNFTHENDGEVISEIALFIEVFSHLDFELASITQLDIARDTNTNTIKKYRSMIKDTENFDMILNGKVIENPKEKLKNYGEYFGRCREKIESNPTLYFEQQRERSPKLKIYNKSREISDENNNKNYIVEWNNFGRDTFYRTELTIYWRDLKDLLPNLQIDISHPNALVELLRPHNLAAIFEEVAPRLIRFRDRNGNVVLPSAI